MFIKAGTLKVILAFVIILLTGCSGPQIIGPAPAEKTEYFDAEVTSSTDTGHSLFGLWEITFDPATMSAHVQAMRNAQPHYDVTYLVLQSACPDCLKVIVNSYDPVTSIFDVDVIMWNLYEKTPYDLRGIIYTNNAGRMMLNPDDWTGLWDIPGGMQINPFKSYAKDAPQRVFPPDAEYTENIVIYAPSPWDPVDFCVDVAWPGNCREPYEISNFIQDDIQALAGSSGNIYVDVLDWQDDVDDVEIYVPELTGDISVGLAPYDGNTWSALLTNTEGAEPGEYDALITATSADSDTLALYDIVTITISQNPEPVPEESAMPWLTISPHDICVDGDYSYIASGVNGLNIFDVSSPADSLWLNHVQTEGNAGCIALSGGYVYIGEADTHNLAVIDVEPPEAAYILAQLPVAEGPLSIAISGNLAYLACGESGMAIVDISSPAAPSIINTVDTPGHAFDVAATGEYAYIADGPNGLQIIDISPPESAFIVKEVDLEGDAYDVAVLDSYAFLTADGLGSVWVDIDPIENAHLEKTQGTVTFADITVSPGYIYSFCTNNETGWCQRIIQMTNTPYEGLYLGSYGDAHALAVSVPYIFWAEGWSGFSILDLDFPDYHETVFSMDTEWDVHGAAVSGEYAYVADEGAGIRVIDIDPLEQANITDLELNHGDALNITVSGEYACLADGDAGVELYHISTPGHAFNCSSLTTPGRAMDVAAEGDYIFIADGPSGLQVAKRHEIAIICPSEIVKGIDTPGYANAIDLSGDHAYMAAWTSGLQIFDVAVPENAFLAKTVDTPGKAHGVAVAGQYAYVGDTSVGVVIVDVSPVASAHIVSTVDTPGDCIAMDYAGGYLFVADGDAGLQIIDAIPVESASIIQSFDTPGYAENVTVSGEYAYVSCGERGLEIIKLW